MRRGSKTNKLNQEKEKKKKKKTLTHNFVRKRQDRLSQKKKNAYLSFFGNSSEQTTVCESSLGLNSVATVECCGNINYRGDVWLFISCPHPQMSVGWKQKSLPAPPSPAVLTPCNRLLDSQPPLLMHQTSFRAALLYIFHLKNTKSRRN